MENVEDELDHITNAANAEVAITEESGTLSEAENLNDSLEIIEDPIEVIDLTTPQASTSSSNSAGAVGDTNLMKRSLEEASKETKTDQNPSTSAAPNSTTSSSSSNILECPICLQTCIHPARLPCGHIFCFLCVKGVAYKNRRCAMCRREIPPEFLDHPQLVNGIEDICTTKATDDGYQWFYEGRNGGWWAFEKRNACEIEEAFQNLFNHQINSRKAKEENNIQNNEGDEQNVNVNDSEGEAKYNKNNNNPFTYDIQVCGKVYVMDFEKMVQYPKAMPYRKRKICRAKGLPAKGVAGIFTSKRKCRRQPY